MLNPYEVHRADQRSALVVAKERFEKITKDGRKATAEERVEIEELLARADVSGIRKQLADGRGHRRTIPDQPATGPVENRVYPVAHSVGTISKHWGDTPAERSRNAYEAGMFLLSVAGNAQAIRWCERNGIHTRALAENINTAGGNLVPDGFEATIIKLREDFGIFRQHTKVLPMVSDHIFIPRRSGGITATFTAENVALTESDPSWNNVELTAKKLGAITRMSTELNEDSIVNLANEVGEEFALALAFKEDTVGFVGTGIASHGGILGIQTEFDSNEGTYVGSVNAVSGENLLSEFTTASIGSLMGALPQYAVRNAKFFCSSSVNEIVFGKLLVAGGGNTMRDLSEERRPQYLGHEIVVSQVLRGGTAATDMNNVHFILYGDLAKSSTMGERRGITVGTSDQRYFELDQIAMKVTERIDINNHDLGDDSTVGPMVALKGNTP